MDKVGHQLEKYRLVALLGRGSFAEVYLGQHIQIHNLYAAIKILHTRLSESYQDGFRREAEIIADLRHPNIIRILDYGIDPSDNSPYLSMDYARQGTLRKRHPKGSTVPLGTLLSYMKQIVSALQYAHDRNLIHRDLKPENLLLGENDEIVVSDFGIATVVHATSTLETSAYSGTAAYSAPEQILGKPRVQSDQYALGIILYEWLTGDLPFHGSFPELCAQHLYALPQPLHEKVRDIPREVEEVVMTALAKDPHQRFQRIQAFAKALEQAYALSSSPTLLAEKPVPSQPPPTEERPIQKPEQVPLQGEIASIPPQQSAGETPLRTPSRILWKRYAESAWQRSITQNTRWCPSSYPSNQLAPLYGRSPSSNEQPIPSNQLAPLYGRSPSSSVEISPPARKSNSSKGMLPSTMFFPVWIFLAVVIAIIIVIIIMRP